MKQSQLTIENAELLSQLKFEFSSHASYSTGGERWDKAIYKGLILFVCCFTRRNGDSWGKGKNTYFIDEETKEYKDLNEFLNRVRELTSMKVYERPFIISSKRSNMKEKEAEYFYNEGKKYGYALARDAEDLPTISTFKELFATHPNNNGGAASETFNPHFLIETYIASMFGNIEITSVQYFIETGKINGSFLINLLALIEKSKNL